MALSFRSPGRIRPALIALVLALTLPAGIAPRPASADSAAVTRNIILGAAAVAAAIIINNNIHHKQLAHDTVVGRTSDGGTVYADGRIVYPNGDVLYTSNGNGQPCNWQGYGYQRCNNQPVAYYPQGQYYGHRHDNGHHYGWYKHHHRDGDEEGDEDRHGRGEHHGHGGD